MLDAMKMGLRPSMEQLSILCLREDIEGPTIPRVGCPEQAAYTGCKYGHADSKAMDAWFNSREEPVYAGFLT